MEAAARGGCEHLLTENPIHGQVIAGARVENPFREWASAPGPRRPMALKRGRVPGAVDRVARFARSRPVETGRVNLRVVGWGEGVRPTGGRPLQPISAGGTDGGLP